MTKKDDAPLALRRPFVRLARSIVTPAMVDAIRDRAAPQAVVDLLPRFHRRDLQGPWRVFWWDLSNVYAVLMNKAGRGARTWKAVERAHEITVTLNKYSKKWIEKHGGELCVELSAQQHSAVKTIVASGYAKGARPEEIAQHLRSVVGLTKRQQSAVDKYRDDGALDDQVDRYAAKQLAYRVENISRTENRYAVEQGRLSEWLTARDDGELPDNTRKVWSSSPVSHRLCEICEAMDQQTVGLDEPFVTPDGDEIDAPPSHPQCRCTSTITTD